MDPRDLSQPGWRQRLGRTEENTIVLGEEVIREEEITGVLTRLPCVFEEELNYIEQPDRKFVAAEMNAFLTFWLSSLECRVVNQPTVGCLNGPALSQRRWMQVAARAGLTIRPDAFSNDPDPEAVTSVTVVGGRCPGGGDGRLQELACGLARAVEADFLAVRFVGMRFLDVNLLPEIADAGIRQAVLELFEGRR